MVSSKYKWYKELKFTFKVPYNSEHYKNAEKISAALSEMGFTIMTGGGSGIMEAANKEGNT